MGIIIDTLSILAGAFLGSVFKERVIFKNFTILSISIMIISLVGFFENIFDVNAMNLKSNDLLLVVFALIIGTMIGDKIQFEERISNISSFGKNGFSEVTDAVIFFGVGGLQICGPILLATIGDNSQLILKSIVDFPFAIMFGISYGKKISLAALPVGLIQLVIVMITILSRNFFSETVIKQLCAMGYIILFFSGFNLICEKKHKINNTNMIMGIFIILAYNIVHDFWRGIT